MDATCNVQDSIHVFHLVHNMCPGFWVHIRIELQRIFTLISIVIDAMTFKLIIQQLIHRYKGIALRFEVVKDGR